MSGVTDVRVNGQLIRFFTPTKTKQKIEFAMIIFPHLTCRGKLKRNVLFSLVSHKLYIHHFDLHQSTLVAQARNRLRIQ